MRSQDPSYQGVLGGAWRLSWVQALSDPGLEFKAQSGRLGVSVSANIAIECISVTFGIRDPQMMLSPTDNHLAGLVPFKYRMNLPNVFSGCYLQVGPCHRADDIAGTHDKDVGGLFPSVF